MSNTFVIPRAFDPTYSLLGRWLRKDTDRLRSEARYYLYAVTVFVLVTLASLVVWALFKDRIVADPDGPVAVTYFVGQVVGVVVCVLTCLVGFSPSTVVTLSRGTIGIRCGDRSMTLKTREIRSIETVTGFALQRHYRRFAGLHEFVARPQEHYVLLRTENEGVVLGLPEPQQEELLRHLRRDEQPGVVSLSKVGQ